MHTFYGNQLHFLLFFHRDKITPQPNIAWPDRSSQLVAWTMKSICSPWVILRSFYKCWTLPLQKQGHYIDFRKWFMNSKVMKWIVKQIKDNNAHLDLCNVIDFGFWYTVNLLNSPLNNNMYGLFDWWKTVVKSKC